MESMVVKTRRWQAFDIEHTNGGVDEISSRYTFDMRDISSIEEYIGDHFQDVVVGLVEIEKDFDKLVIEGDYDTLSDLFKKSRERGIGGMFN